MAFKLNHLHLKSPDPKKTADFYVENLGATIVSEGAGGSSFRLDLHGLPLNVTGMIDSQTHEQNMGIEHIAIDTDDMPAAVAKLRASGAKILEETSVGNGRKVTFFEGPEGVCLEVLEMPK
jgi:catechol 2,3-dioxygenase-like lactoylglutathione lyase family enzyme